MIVQTAFLRCPPAMADSVAAALARVAATSLADEPETVDYLVLRGPSDGNTVLFTTVESFSGIRGMETHNNSAAVAAFFEEAGRLLSGPPEVIVNTVVPPAGS
jgi:quinol monooxygenase YgiN